MLKRLSNGYVHQKSAAVVYDSFYTYYTRMRETVDIRFTI